MDKEDVIVGENLASNKSAEYDKVKIGGLDKSTNKGAASFNQDIFGNIPVDVNVVLGQSKISLQKIIKLTKGDIVEIDKNVGENVDLLVNGQLIAQGEIVAVGENYGVKVNKVVAK